MKHVPLKDVCRITMGQSPASSSYNAEGRGLPFFQGNADFGERHPRTRLWCDAPSKIAHAGDILLSVRAPIGAVNLARETCCIGRGLAAVTPDPAKVFPLFAYWFLISKNPELNRQGTGSTFKAISKSIVENIEIFVPDLPTQQRIASILENLQTTLRLRRSQLSSLDTLVKARFVEMFGDPVVGNKNLQTISSVGKIFTGNTPSMKEAAFYDSLDIPFVKPGNLAEHGVTRIENVETFVSEKARNTARIMPEGAILVTCIGTIGKIGIATRECCCNQQINFIVPNENINFVYLAHCLTFFVEKLKDMANAPVVPILNKTRFSSLKIPVPPLPLQNQFSSFVSQVERTKATIRASLAETQRLFDSLMQEYFT